MSSPYLAPGFYDRAIAEGRHREIVGGRWDETGRVQMECLRAEGMAPHHRLLDIGAGALRLGCKAVPFLAPGNYWATDASRPLMLAGHAHELPDPARLDPARLIEDADFALPGVPAEIDFAIAFGVFPHLPALALPRALAALRARCPRLSAFLFTVFLAPEEAASHRQADGVVTHRDRPPRHLTEAEAEAAAPGWSLSRRARMLPRGQALYVAKPNH